MTSRPVSRRTVATGLAWTVPAVAVASTVPAFAASPCAGPASLTGVNPTGTYAFPEQNQNGKANRRETFTASGTQMSIANIPTGVGV